MAKKIAFIVALVLVVTGFLSISAHCQPQSEYKVKAGYVFNIPAFAEWPKNAGFCEAFTICVVGESPIFDILSSSQKKVVKNLPVVVERVEEVTEKTCCQVLFIAASERYRLQKLLPAAHEKGIMTVSDIEDFENLGGMVSLVTRGDRVIYNLNLTAARKADISFSSQLLKLANGVVNR